MAPRAVRWGGHSKGGEEGGGRDAVLSDERGVGHAQRAGRKVVALEEVGEVWQLDDLVLPRAAGDEGAHEVHRHLQPPRGVHHVEKMEVVLEPLHEERRHGR